jgi:hypothetical protein
VIITERTDVSPSTLTGCLEGILNHHYFQQYGIGTGTRMSTSIAEHKFRSIRIEDGVQYLLLAHSAETMLALLAQCQGSKPSVGKSIVLSEFVLSLDGYTSIKEKYFPEERWEELNPNILVTASIAPADVLRYNLHISTSEPRRDKYSDAALYDRDRLGYDQWKTEVGRIVENIVNPLFDQKRLL